MYKPKTISLFLFCWLTAALTAAQAQSSLLEPERLIEALQQGGLVVFFRHTATDHTQDDRHPVDLADCTTQRNLSLDGRQQAEAIGRAISRLNIVVDEVISSPFCRCRDTAQLMFGRYRVDDELYFTVALDKPTRIRQSEHLRRLLAIPPATGRNRVIVSHTGNLREATGIWPKPEGAAWVFRPRGEDGYDVMGMLGPGDWSNAP
jgi:broad specificity phosphatase PhoE